MVRSFMAGQASDKSGVVLAAGLGTRLAEVGDAKPLMQVQHVSLLMRTLDNLRLAGCSHGVIVVGHQADAVRAGVESSYAGPLDLEFVFNRQFELKNGVSVLCARPFVGEEFVLTMADHVFDASMLELVRSHRPAEGGATLCVDFKIDTIFDMDDATKVQVEGDRIVAIGKELVSFNAIDTGLFSCTPALMDSIESVYREAGDASLSDGVARLAAAGKMAALDVGGAFWQDVDTPEMLAHAEKMLLHRAAG